MRLVFTSCLSTWFGCSTHACPHFMQTTTCRTLLANIYMSELSCTSDSTADQRVLICWQIWTCHYWFRYFCLLSLNSTAGQRTSKQQTCFWRATTVGLTRLSLLTSSTWFPVAMKPWCRELHPNVRFRDSFKATIATSGGSYDTKPPCSWHERATVFMTRKTNCNPCFWHDHILSMKPMILSMYCLCYMLLTWNFLCFCHTSMNVFMTREENRDSDTTSYSRLNSFKSNVLLSLFMLKTTNTFLTRDHKRVSDTTIRTCFCRKKTTFLLTRNYLQFLTRTHTLGWRHVIANVLSMYWCRQQQTCFWHDTTNVFLTKPPVFLTRPHTIGKTHIMVNVLSMFDVSNFFYLSRCRCILKST